MRQIVFFLLAAISFIHAEENAQFKIVVLGCHGGPVENNLSGYLVAPRQSNDFVALDAGTLLGGIAIAIENHSFEELKQNHLDFKFNILRNHIKAYLISHAHLDHVAGLIINSTADIKKPIFGIDSTIDFLRDYLFNWKIWPNFGSEGKKPLNQYQYIRLSPREKTTLPNTQMTVESFLLSHPDGYQSTAFLLETSGYYLLYFGDTSPDALEPKKRIEAIWKRIAPILLQNKLRAIFLECSYVNEQDENQLWGHLNPKYMMEELNRLAFLVNPNNPQDALKNIPVVVTHIKNSILKNAPSIQEELERQNNLGISFIFPEQGKKLEF